MRTVRSVDVSATDVGHVENGIEDLYEDKVDVIVVRSALAAGPLAAAGERLDRSDRDPG